MEMPTSALTGISLKDMFDAGLHFGHQTKRWNPKMKGYIFDKRNGIHIIDLTQSVALLDEAAQFLKDTVLAGKKILFVATKKQVSELVKGAAESVEQFYMTERWLGGTLTNAKTLRSSVRRMRELSEHKQEASMLRRELNKLEKNLTGVADMAELPGAVVVVDVVREANAVKEAVRLHIPVVAIVDTNADPEPIDYVIPGNDDSVRGVELVLNGLVKVIKTANDEYGAKAAEENRKREQERKSRDEAEKAARAERRAKAATRKPAAGGAAAKKSGVAASVKAAARAAKEAAETKAKADLAAKRKAKVAEAEAAVAAAAEAPKAEPAAEEAPKAE